MTINELIDKTIYYEIHPGEVHKYATDSDYFFIKHAPTLAKALQIAIEALDLINCNHNDFAKGDPRLVAEEAISKINSLADGGNVADR